MNPLSSATQLKYRGLDNTESRPLTDIKCVPSCNEMILILYCLRCNILEKDHRDQFSIDCSTISQILLNNLFTHKPDSATYMGFS